MPPGEQGQTDDDLLESVARQKRDNAILRTPLRKFRR